VKKKRSNPSKKKRGQEVEKSGESRIIISKGKIHFAGKITQMTSLRGNEKERRNLFKYICGCAIPHPINRAQKCEPRKDNFRSLVYF